MLNKISEEIPSWAQEEYDEAKELKITDGSRPHDAATRMEVAIMIVRALKLRK